MEQTIGVTAAVLPMRRLLARTTHVQSCPFRAPPAEATFARFRQLLTLLVLMFISPQPARAETRRWSVRGTLNLALMVSSDQVQRLSYDQPGVVGTVYGGVALSPQVELRAGMLGGPFLSSKRETGGLLGGSLGARLLLPSGRLRPYAALDAGVAATGEVVRPLLSLTAGVDLPLSQRVALGPALGYARVFQWNGPRYSTDASNFSVGASLFVELGASAPVRSAPPPRVVALERPAPAAEPESAPLPDPELLVLLERALPAPLQRVELLAPVLFGFDSDELEPIGIAMLHEVAATLHSRAELELVQIQGYADERGSTAYNEALSQRRAERVRDWLVAHGVAPERLVVEPHGASTLVERSGEESAHTQNRRVVFRVLKQAAP
jgi:OOP family OmpA-OmpF porin